MHAAGYPGYVVTRGGTFGIVSRVYHSDLINKDMALVTWGPLRWITPVLLSDVRPLKSRYESEARAEAEQWLKSFEA